MTVLDLLTAEDKKNFQDPKYFKQFRKEVENELNVSSDVPDA